MTGPLSTLRIVELGGQGPGPFAVMMLADLGAQVIRVDRSAAPDRRSRHEINPLHRGRLSISLDLKDVDDRRRLHGLLRDADVLIDPFRPGVLEGLGLAPEVLMQEFPRLIVARMTGWGQDGPLARAAGHDLNYIAVAGLLDTVGRPDSGPVIPPMYLADFAGGGMALATGILAALVEQRVSGRGQVIDHSMLDGSLLLSVAVHGLLNRGEWNLTRGTNYLDGGAHFYQVYRTADDRFMAVAAIERPFYLAFLDGLGLKESDGAGQFDAAGWPDWIRRCGEVFGGATRQEWVDRFDGTDACVTPVLSVDEVDRHPQVLARGALPTTDGVRQPAPVPRFSRTPASSPRPAPRFGEQTEQILGALSGPAPWTALFPTDATGNSGPIGVPRE